MLEDKELIEQIVDNDRDLVELLLCPYPTADGAQLGYDGEMRSLEIISDDLLDECDRRGLSRVAALRGKVKYVPTDTTNTK